MFNNCGRTCATAAAYCPARTFALRAPLAMALIGSVQDPSQVLTAESAASVAEGTLAILGTQRAEGGYTLYRIVFKVRIEVAAQERERERERERESE